MFSIWLTPSSSDSSLIFFIATISPVFLFCPWCSASKCLKTNRQTQCLETLKTTPYVPSPSLFSLTKSSSLWPERWEVILPRYSGELSSNTLIPFLWKKICWSVQDGGSSHVLLISSPINYFLTSHSKHNSYLSRLEFGHILRAECYDMMFNILVFLKSMNINSYYGCDI